VGEIRLEFSFPAPLERVWQALTDQRQLGVWLMETDFAPIVGHRFMFRPGGLRGFQGPISGVVLECEAPASEAFRRLVMRWRSGQTQSLVTWLVTPSAGGCRLRVTQSDVPGSPAPPADLVETYGLVFGERLRSIVVNATDPVGTAGGERPVGTPGGARPVGTPGGALVGRGQGAARAAPWPAWVRLPLRGPWRVVAAVATLLVVAGVVTTGVWVILPEHRYSRGTGSTGVAPATGGLGSAGASGPTGGAGSTSRPSGPGNPAPGGPGPDSTGPPATLPNPTSTPAPAPAPGHPIATYRVRDEVPLSRYVIDVTVTNDGGSAFTGWTVAIALSGQNLIVAASSKYVTQDVMGGKYVFEPTAEIETVGPGQSVAFTISVTGLFSGVASCTIDGRACLAG